MWECADVGLGNGWITKEDFSEPFILLGMPAAAVSCAPQFPYFSRHPDIPSEITNRMVVVVVVVVVVVFSVEIDNAFAGHHAFAGTVADTL
jgi:hypothetical protein